MYNHLGIFLFAGFTANLPPNKKNSKRTPRNVPSFVPCIKGNRNEAVKVEVPRWLLPASPPGWRKVYGVHFLYPDTRYIYIWHIFTYMNGGFLWYMYVNVPYIEHLGWGSWLTFWEWFHGTLRTFRRRWLYTLISIWQGDWIPKDSWQQST